MFALRSLCRRRALCSVVLVWLLFAALAGSRAAVEFASANLLNAHDTHLVFWIGVIVIGLAGSACGWAVSACIAVLQRARPSPPDVLAVQGSLAFGAYAAFSNRCLTCGTSGSLSLVGTGIAGAGVGLVFVHLVRRLSRSARWAGPATAVALAIGAGALSWITLDVSPPAISTAGPLEMSLPRTNRKVLLVAFDGLDARLMKSFVAKGRMPTFARLLEKAAYLEVESPIPAWSPVIWTSVITGKEPSQHGIFGFHGLVFRGLQGIVQRRPESRGCGGYLFNVLFRLGEGLGLVEGRPVTGNYRQASALWDILSARARRVAIVNWWATFPADPVKGVLLTDRFHHAAVESTLARPHRVTYPDSLFDELSAMAVRPNQLAESDVGQFFPKRPAVAGPAVQTFGLFSKSLDWPMRERLTLAYLSYDSSYANAAAHLARKDRFDFMCVYLREIDVVSHLFGGLSRVYGRNRDPDLERYAGALEAAYERADGLLAGLWSLADEETTLVVMSDHGFTWQPNGEFGHARVAPPGVLLMTGAGIKPGQPAKRVRPEDIAPTVLYLLDEPFGLDMNGRILHEAIDPAVWNAQPLRFVPSYDESFNHSRALERNDYDDQFMEELKALGYIR